MSTPALPDMERLRRKEALEALVNEGFAPPGVRDGRPSACEALKRRDGVNYPRWILDERRRQAKGERHFLPCFVGLEVDGREEITLTGAEVSPVGDEEPVATAHDHAGVRARTLAGEIRSLVTGSKWPLVNPEAIVVDGFVTKRYSAKTGKYQYKEGTPRTYVSETLRVAPIPDCRNKKFILTCAQNDTQVHAPFWRNLVAYAEHVGAEIAVAGSTYCSSWWDESNPTARSYDPIIAEHLCFGDLSIGSDFVFCASVNIIPTASQPITDLVTYPRNRHGVFAHPKRQLKSVPSTDPKVQAKIVCTTGSVTVPKLIPRKAGQKAIFHSVIGAVIVEFDAQGRYFCRQITANSDDGSFYDLDRLVDGRIVSTGHRARALVCGDIHLRKADPTNFLTTFGFSPGTGTTCRNPLIDALDPEHILLHDCFDNESRNHHNAGDNAHSFEMAVRGRDSVLSEVVQVGAFLDRLSHPDRTVIVVESNHDIGLERYVREGRYRCDGRNVRLGLQLEDAYLAHRQRVGDALDADQSPPSFSMLEHAVRLSGADLDGVEWVHDGKSRVIDEIEVGNHGFRGANGSKGTVQGFARMGRRLTVGDKHCCEINEGVYVAGVMNLTQGYNKGASGWTVGHVLHYSDGHRTVIVMQDGLWCADERPRIRIPAAEAA